MQFYNNTDCFYPKTVLPPAEFGGGGALAAEGSGFGSIYTPYQFIKEHCPYTIRDVEETVISFQNKSTSVQLIQNYSSVNSTGI